MEWVVEVTDEFTTWWNGLDEAEQVSLAASVGLLEQFGTALRYPYSSSIKTSRHGHMRELRVQHHGQPYRVLYAFDPRRVAILLVGGSKVGDDRWYNRHVPIADRIYEQHIKEITREKLIE